MSVQIRSASESDRAAVSEVVVAAFGDAQGPEISDLIANLTTDPSALPVLSLIASADGVIVGHILFTNVRIIGPERLVSAAILAPLAVHPDYQGQGIGSRLAEEGLRQLRSAGVELVFVLGHADYYPRFGFAPAGGLGLDAPYPIPAEHSDAWMVMALQPGILGNISGRVECAEALNDPRHWSE